MKKKVLAAILLAVGVLTGCGNSEPISSPIQTVEAEPIATDTKEVEQPAATESSATVPVRSMSRRRSITAGRSAKSTRSAKSKTTHR